MSYKLDKPYTDKQYADFVVEHNHNNGRTIEETETAVYALEANEMMNEDGMPVINPNYEAEQAQKERERLDMLNLTAADVERAIYKAKGMDFDDVMALVEQYNEAAPMNEEGQSTAIDIKALKIELKANNFYRGNPYINAVGTLLGFTSEQLDEFFETNDYTKLLPPAEEDTSEAVGEGEEETEALVEGIDEVENADTTDTES